MSRKLYNFRDAYILPHNFSIFRQAMNIVPKMLVIFGDTKMLVIFGDTKMLVIFGDTKMGSTPLLNRGYDIKKTAP